MSSKDRLGRFLRDQRRRRDWTQQEVAAKLQLRGLHVGSRTISKHETGQQIPDGDPLRHYAELYEVEFRELVALAAASTYEVADPERIDHRLQQLTGEETIDPPPRPTPPRRRKYWLGATVLAAFALAATLAWLALERLEPPSPTQARVVDNRLVALADERPLWSVPFPDLGKNPREPLVRDIDEDGRSEVFFAVRRPAPQTVTENLQSYSPDGELRWEIPLGRTWTIRGRVFSPYYRTHHLAWVETRQATYLLVVAVHHRWYPTQVLLLDPRTGETISEYWHPGHINAFLVFDVGSDGTLELLLGGMNNPDHGPGHPILAVLDIPFRETTHHPNLFGPQNSREHSYLVLPRPDLTEVHTHLVGVETLQQVAPRRFVASTRTADCTLLFYEFDADLEVTDLRPTDTMIRFHDRFAVEGHLDHRYNPEELHHWKHVLRFPTAPDGNNPEIRAAFAALRTEGGVSNARLESAPQDRLVSR